MEKYCEICNKKLAWNSKKTKCINCMKDENNKKFICKICKNKMKVVIHDRICRDCRANINEEKAESKRKYCTKCGVQLGNTSKHDTCLKCRREEPCERCGKQKGKFSQARLCNSCAKTKIDKIKKMSTCIICGKVFEIVGNINRPKKTCSSECLFELKSRINSGKNNPFFGKKLSKKHFEALHCALKNGFKNTKPERIVENILKLMKLKYEKQFAVNYKDKRYYFDFYLKEYNILIEVDGIYWHCKPSEFDRNFYHKTKKMYAYEIWEYDKNKNESAKELGYKVVRIWESEENNLWNII